MAPVGFIGIGIMGEGMAGRLLSEGVAGTDESPLVGTYEVDESRASTITIMLLISVAMGCSIVPNTQFGTERRPNAAI